MKKLVLSLSLVLAFSSATAAFAAIPQNIRIGTDPTYAPFESKNSQGELVGFDIDLAKELCKRINTQGRQGDIYPFLLEGFYQVIYQFLLQHM